MIENAISEQVLTIGPSLSRKGGISQVVNTYKDEIYETFNYVPYTLDISNSVLRQLSTLTAVARLTWQLVFNRRLRIVHIHAAARVNFPRSVMWMQIAKLAGKKVIMHMHGSTFREYFAANTKFVRRMLPKTDMVIALSRSWRDFYKDTAGAPRVTIIPNIVASPYDVDTPADDGLVHAVCFGRIGNRKGTFDLLQAIASRQDQLRGKLKLHVGGDGKVDKFKSTVRALGLDDIVEYVGWVTGDDKERLLHISQISVLPSYNEGLPISLLEGMAHSHALISTTVGGIPEILDADNGVIHEPGDITTLADALVSLVNDPAKRHQMGNVSLSRVRPYMADNVADSLTQLYREVLSN